MNHPTAKLRPYQIEDIEFLKTYKCMACFNEQRTGKTPTAIRAMVDREILKILVVCPASALYPWGEAFTFWSGLPATVVAGTLDKKRQPIDSWDFGALIVSYGTLKSTLLQNILDREPVGVILDEAHRIKDPKTKNAKAAFELTKTIPYRLALTGTPAPNKPEEIWSILHFLYPQTFKSYWNFIEEYFKTILRDNGRGQRFKEVTGIKPNRAADLLYKISCIATQRKRKDVMAWLPEKEYQKILLPPTKLQLKYLEELQNYFETENVVTHGILDRLIRYRQICLHPGLLHLKGTSPKLDWIKEYLEDYTDRPTIIFSKFTSFLHILDKEIDVPHGIIVGATPSAERAALVKAFQAGKLNLLLINLDAGKEALTLDRAEAIIFTDKYPPVGDIEQAEDRFIATTEDKADKAHIIYELIIKGTYDEELYTMLARRAQAIDAINNFEKYMKGDKR